jgi:pimeloyl-ACP methyl ester carboxylesterase
MPYVDIAQGSDFASLWYVTNSPTGHVSSFDPEKSTVILLHPFFLDSTWVDSQFCDPRLNEEHNLIAFDQRAAGRSRSRPNGKQDSWTDAADLAFACHVRDVDAYASRPSLLKTAFSRHSGYHQRIFGQVRRQRLIWVSASLHCTQSPSPSNCFHI